MEAAEEAETLHAQRPPGAATFAIRVMMSLPMPPFGPTAP